ncbi:hypothetical protein BH23ACT5_BH23ACT5_00280 [soil metagenome]
MVNVHHQGDMGDLFGRLPVALYRTSPHGEVLTANAATAELLGYETLDEMLACQGVAENAYVDPGGRDAWRRSIEEEGIVHDFLTRLRRRDGGLIWVRDTARAVCDDDGQIRFYEGVLTDVSLEVRATSASSVLAGVLEATSDFVIVFDERGVLQYANAAARGILGIPEEFHRRRPGFEEVFPGRMWKPTFERLSASGGWSGEFTVTDSEGRATPLWTVTTVHEGRDRTQYLSAIARDLTPMKDTQRRLEELVTAKDVFVATVSHELRNPLAGVVGLAEEMRDRFDDFGDSERHDLITLIAHQASEMSSIVDDLLVAARSDVGEVAVVPELTEVMGQLKGAIAGVKISVTVNLPTTELWAWVDPQRFRQIVRNLISNAERHGGDRMRISAGEVDGMAVIEVADNGPGVSEADVERIFEPYQRADRSELKSGSVGLGLSVARRLARLMGGEVDYSHDGAWATFQVRVPTAEVSKLRAAD